jgi:hypothetical protein
VLKKYWLRPVDVVNGHYDSDADQEEDLDAVELDDTENAEVRRLIPPRTKIHAPNTPSTPSTPRSSGGPPPFPVSSCIGEDKHAEEQTATVHVCPRNAHG